MKYQDEIHGPLPEYDINPDGIMVLCKASDRYLRLMKGEVHVLGQGDQESDQETWDAIIVYCSSPKSASEIMKKFDIERSYFRRHFLDKMLEQGILKRTEPDNLKSRNQKYYS